MSILSNRPSNRELLTLFLCLGIWLVVTALFVGIRPEHPMLIALIAVLFCAHPQTKKLVIALLPFILFAVSYDWMNIVPNYKVNPIDVQDLYEAEKSLFGITTAAGVSSTTSCSTAARSPAAALSTPFPPTAPWISVSASRPTKTRMPASPLCMRSAARTPRYPSVIPSTRACT